MLTSLLCARLTSIPLPLYTSMEVRAVAYGAISLAAISLPDIGRREVYTLVNPQNMVGSAVSPAAP